MAQIIYSGSLNVPALTADDLYVQILAPPGYVTGVPTDVIGLVGTASWGPKNFAVHIGSAQEALRAFGPISAAALTGGSGGGPDPYDLATDLALAFGQASSQATLEGWAVRVTDGTDIAASVGLVSGAAGSAEFATLTGSVTVGDALHLTFTSTGILGSPLTVTYVILATDSLYSAAVGLANAVNTTAALTSAGIYATAATNVTTLNYPSTLTVSFGASVTGAATEVITLTSGAGSTTGVTLTAIYTGSLGNQIKAAVVAGAAANSNSVVVAGPQGLSEIYVNLPQTGFWAALAQAINLGQGGARGPSLLVRASGVNIGAGSPTVASYSFSGGTDGRTGVTTATLLGVDGAPGTGLFALRNQSPAVGVSWIVGLTDFTAWATCLGFAQSEGTFHLATLPPGTSTATALADVGTYGVHDPSFAYVKDWVYFFDPLNNVTRLVPPTAIIGGKTATLAPQISPGNKQVNLVVGTERFNPWTGSQQYTISEIGQLASAGVLFIAKPIPAGNTFGIRHGRSTSLAQVTQPVEYWRLTAYLARSFAATMGSFVDQNQSQQPNDPLRSAVRNQLNGFLQFLTSPASGAGDGLGQIDAYSVVCGFSQNGLAGNGINTPSSIAQHYLFALARVTYLSSVWYFILSLQGGTTVVTVGSSPGSSVNLGTNAAA